ncbi:MAG TPA: ROK family protein [Bacillales bacterium]
MKDERTAAAIDIGGTKTIVGLVDSSGDILAKQQFPTSTQENPQIHIKKCVERLRACLQAADLKEDQISGVGISAPGLVASEDGILLEAPYIGWKNVDFRKLLNNEWPSIKVRVENDVNACALGESLFGCGQDFRHFVWVTVSTGIGGALVINGDLYYGEHQIAGEIGHFIVEWVNGRRCGCGNSGCLEAHASGTAIAHAAMQRVKREGDQSPLARYFRDQSLEITSENTALAARHSVQAAHEIFQLAGESIGKAFSYVANLLNPGAIIVGGGVTQSFDLLEPHITRVVRSAVIGDSNRSIPILKTDLGYEAAFLGAASLVFLKRNIS